MDRPGAWDYAIFTVVAVFAVFFIGPELGRVTGIYEGYISIGVILVFIVLHRLYKMWKAGDTNAS